VEKQLSVASSQLPAKPEQATKAAWQKYADHLHFDLFGSVRFVHECIARERVRLVRLGLNPGSVPSVAQVRDYLQREERKAKSEGRSSRG
jgi:hypothetical protein